MKFYLGTHQPNWLQFSSVPMFVSDVRLRRIQKLKPATCDWALDSGGYSELSKYGEWRTGPREYAKRARRYAQEIGRLDFAAVQDWMCEPWMLDKTGLDIQEHQERTVNSLLNLMLLEPCVPWAPVLQGYELDDYLRHLDWYDTRRIDLSKFKVVGVGTLCRRHATKEAIIILRAIRERTGLPLHGFGFKSTGLVNSKHILRSADSLAWSFAARQVPPLPGHITQHRHCNNCFDYALLWREKLMRKLQ